MKEPEWKPTLELRWTHNPSAVGRPHVLQQRFQLHQWLVVSTGPYAAASEPQLCQTGTFEWRDIPTVPWRSNDDPD